MIEDETEVSHEVFNEGREEYLRPKCRNKTGSKFIMQINEAIKAFSQSEKLKSGLIWATHIIEMNIALPESEKPATERVLKTLISMISNEIHVAKKAAPHEAWTEAEKDMDTAMAMLSSGVAHESSYHLTQALTKVTTIGQQSMSHLVDEGLL